MNIISFPCENGAAWMQTSAVYHFHNKDNKFIISSPLPTWIKINTTSFKFKVLVLEIRENMSPQTIGQLRQISH